MGAFARPAPDFCGLLGPMAVDHTGERIAARSSVSRMNPSTTMPSRPLVFA